MRETEGRSAPQAIEVEKYAATHGVDLRAIELDVLSQQSCDAAIQEIISRHGRLDVLIHNAGHMVCRAVLSSHIYRYIRAANDYLSGNCRVSRSILY